FMPVKLGQRIRALRRLKRVTQQELATRLDLSVTMLSNIERGLKEPSPQLLERIARELDVPREELFIIKESADVPYITELPGRATGY
ncbi:MAG: helix-turn-helix transcriptional regulator, partial [Dethiobacteria bacterium]